MMVSTFNNVSCDYNVMSVTNDININRITTGDCKDFINLAKMSYLCFYTKQNLHTGMLQYIATILSRSNLHTRIPLPAET